MPPDPVPRRGRPQPAGFPVGRRAVLRAAGAGLVGVSLAGCGVDWDRVRVDDVATPAPPRLGPDDLARFAAVVSVRALLDLAGAVADPAAGPVAERHRAQLDQLGPLPGPVPSSSATPSGWPTTSPPPTGTPDLATLAAAELAAGTALLGSAAGPGSQVRGPLALLLASVGVGCRDAAATLGAQVVPAPLPGRVDPGEPVPAAAELVALVEAHRAGSYAYGLVAVRLADPARNAARAAIGSHLAAAQQLAELGAATGVDVPAARPGYAVTAPADAVAAQALALQLELDVAAAAGALLAVTTGAWRTLAADHLAAVTLAARTWGAVPDFPGAPGLG